MLWSQNASPIRSQNLCLVVCISLVFGALSSLPDLSDKSCTFKVTLHNFRVILSWELKNHSIVPDHYTLQYTVIRPDHVKIVEHCSNITASFCDLTDLWEVLPETYAITVDGFRGNTTLVTCFIDFFLATQSEWISVYHLQQQQQQQHQVHQYLLCYEIERSAKGVSDSGLGAPPDPATFLALKYLLCFSEPQFSYPKGGMMVCTLQRIPLCLSEAGIPAAVATTFWYISEADRK
ncbi:interferon alpha/beta receptor 2 isoform X2 [Leptonychotes weddellii]|uniref:Interferon alpha/beta receptor 2 isoform X2 n=1 Tax=Leptonychotes weddellii TaxID=9713 RepID=A0A7F8Q4K9_LEPWE|nr:interferon alpha/beta receptor 2 isoform X2 [Leptonychotes weddellii]